MSHRLARACIANCCHLNFCLSPTEILEGGVKIIQNKYLSYAPQVNWLDIVKDKTTTILIDDNGPESECEGGSFHKWLCVIVKSDLRHKNASADHAIMFQSLATKHVEMFHAGVLEMIRARSVSDISIPLFFHASV